jgi:hypothetical protein
MHDGCRSGRGPGGPGGRDRRRPSHRPARHLDAPQLATVEQTAERLQVDAKTVRKWRDRFLAEGDDGLLNRSSRPQPSPRAGCSPIRRPWLPICSQRRAPREAAGRPSGRATVLIWRLYRKMLPTGRVLGDAQAMGVINSLARRGNWPARPTEGTPNPA